MRRGRRRDESAASYYYLGCDGLLDSYNAGKSRQKLRCLYLGQFGFSYDIDSIVAAAKRLWAARHNEIEFILVGVGSKKPLVARAAAELPNVIYRDGSSVSDQEIAALAAKCHIGLCSYSMRASQSLPYKLYDYMAMGLYIVNSLPGEAAELVKRHGIGCHYEPENAASLSATLLDLAANIDEVIATGERSLTLAAGPFRAEVIYKRMVSEVLTGIASAPD